MEVQEDGAGESVEFSSILHFQKSCGSLSRLLLPLQYNNNNSEEALSAQHFQWPHRSEWER